MDSNLHHTLWNLAAYTHTHTHQEDEELISLMNEPGLLLCSNKGVPTSISLKGKKPTNKCEAAMALIAFL